MAEVYILFLTVYFGITVSQRKFTQSSHHYLFTAMPFALPSEPDKGNKEFTKSGYRKLLRSVFTMDPVPRRDLPGWFKAHKDRNALIMKDCPVRPGKSDGNDDFFFFPLATIKTLIANANATDDIVLRFGCDGSGAMYSNLAPHLAVMETSIKGQVYPPHFVAADGENPNLPPIAAGDFTGVGGRKSNYEQRNGVIAQCKPGFSEWLGYKHPKQEWVDLLDVTTAALGQEPKVFVALIAVDPKAPGLLNRAKIMIGGAKDKTDADMKNFLPKLFSGAYQVFDNGNQCCTAPE